MQFDSLMTKINKPQMGIPEELDWNYLLGHVMTVYGGIKMDTRMSHSRTLMKVKSLSSKIKYTY